MLGLMNLLCTLCFCRSLLLKELLTVTSRFVVEASFCVYVGTTFISRIADEQMRASCPN